MPLKKKIQNRIVGQQRKKRSFGSLYFHHFVMSSVSTTTTGLYLFLIIDNDLTKREEYKML